MKIMLKFAETREAEPLHNADDGSGVRIETLRHVAHARKHKRARMLKDGANNLLPPCAQPAKFVRDVFGMGGIGYRVPFHGVNKAPEAMGRIVFRRKSSQTLARKTPHCNSGTTFRKLPFLR